jgi:molybdopterin-binding protein
MIARIDARVAEGNAVIFLTYHLHQCAHRARCGMKISARNRLKDRIVDVKEGASPANVKIKVGGGIIRLRLPTKRSSSSNLQGAKPCAVIKTSDFMVELD